MTIENENCIINGCVAVVDDDPAVLGLIRIALECEKLYIVTFPCPEEFLEDFQRQWSKKHKPALVLTDLIMPGMDGVEMVKCMDQVTKEEHIPVCVVTASGEHLKRGGFCRGEVLYKPFELNNLTRMVYRLGGSQLLRKEAS